MIRNKLFRYFLALRPWSFQAAIPSVVLGAVLSWKYEKTLDYSVLLLALAVTLSLQGAANVLNTYFDYVKGYDTEESFGDPTLVHKYLSIPDLWILVLVMYFCAGLSLYTLELVTRINFFRLGRLFWIGVLLTYMYNGGIGKFALKYLALGDITIYITFGPMMAVFGYLTQTGKYSWLPVWYSIPVALRVEAILHANNHRDLESDLRNGAFTVANLLGKSLSRLYMAFSSLWFFVSWLSIPFAWRAWLTFRKENQRDIPAVIAFQHTLFSLLYLVAVLLE
eukprot:jgi/Galph1/2893/GphlegSOOS_G1558.1